MTKSVGGAKTDKYSAETDESDNEIGKALGQKGSKCWKPMNLK